MQATLWGCFTGEGAEGRQYLEGPMGWEGLRVWPEGPLHLNLLSAVQNAQTLGPHSPEALCIRASLS